MNEDFINFAIRMISLMFRKKELINKVEIILRDLR